MKTLAKIIGAAIPIVIYAAAALAQELPQPILDSAPLPKYPPVARAAKIEGIVRISFLLNESGEVTEVKALSGHPMLSTPAMENVKAWRFSMPKSLYRTEWKYETEFVYRLSGHEVDSYEKPKLTVSLSSFSRIEITSDTVKVLESP